MFRNCFSENRRKKRRWGLGTWAKTYQENKGTVGSKFFFFAENPGVCCFIGISLVFEKFWLFWQKIGFSGEASTGNGDFQLFFRASLCLQTEGGWFFQENATKTDTKPRKTKQKPQKNNIFPTKAMFFLGFSRFSLFFFVFSELSSYSNFASKVRCAGRTLRKLTRSN